jgi:glutamate dehydrogenase
VWIRDFKLKLPEGTPVALEQVKPLIEEAMRKVWRGEMENDRFNALVLKATLTWRQVSMLRAYAKYLKQVGFTYSQAAIEHALIQQGTIAATLADYFDARFNPEEKDRDARQERLLEALEKQLAAVTSAADDKILRRYAEVMQATIRTNYYQVAEDKQAKPVISFKFDSSRVPDLPLPKPYAEIFVYGTRVEGIHLRGGKVARGGLRWSDRHEDFRTEVLGLMKAQMVKNSVIVPVGSKGGFVVKKPPASGGREAFMEEGIACYKLYLSGLLDVTDNIAKNKIVPPRQVVRHDDDDPYLVVAADKGTATFSDIANGVSESYGFWLGDAFASGGSAGYDHKAMGITARGGWVSVARHFREMGVDIAKQDFTVAGIGDMAGDVFGNGMLLSDRIRLVAAFNHMHIFIDPNPDAKRSFAERKRLFALPRSTWKDYDATLISKGGGVFERSAKSIPLSKEAQAALGYNKNSATPDELMRAILLAPVDLLWNGGIGTYVKAESETHEQVGDRSNNAVRVNGKELRCKIVGEGGNLGFTQRGRIEYARNNGRINTDAIDNSAGVDCSDHEVNIKIAFSQPMSKGELTREKRDKLLTAMTEEVAGLVLKDNILQTQAISVAEQQGAKLIESQARLIHALEKSGLLNRAIEFLPDDRQLDERKAAKRGLTRPELAVLLAYSKMALFKDMLDSTLPDEAYFASDLERYFPVAMQKPFADAIAKHRLKREIIATVMTNSMVNRAGITYFNDMAENTGATARDIAAAYALVRDAFFLRALWKEIESLEASVPVAAQSDMYMAINRFLERASIWLLRHSPLPLDINKLGKDMAPAIAELAKNRKLLDAAAAESGIGSVSDALVSQSVPEGLAKKIAELSLLASAFDIITVSRQSKVTLAAAASAYFAVGSRLKLGWLKASAGQIATATRWERLAVQALVTDIYDEQRRLTAAVIAQGGDVEKWLAAQGEVAARYDRFVGDLGGTSDIAQLTVALGQVKALVS